MRGLLYVLTALAVIGLAFWAYQENYKTQAEIAKVRQLYSDIGAAHEALTMLRAELAYLNRPDRLTDLADLNFDRLGLLPLVADSFGAVDQIIYPQPTFSPITDPVSLSYDAQALPENDL